MYQRTTTFAWAQTKQFPVLRVPTQNTQFVLAPGRGAGTCFNFFF